LTQRFIDKRTAVLMRHLRDEEQLELMLDESGAVSTGVRTYRQAQWFSLRTTIRARKEFTPDPACCRV
jgi:hypothetical protein